MLGGLLIAEAGGLVGHSDADAVLHAITDAILGAIAAGDIGEHFPDTDPRWSQADSSIFVEHAAALAAAGGWGVGNCDVTILAEKPNLSPFKAEMAARIADLLGVSAAAVSIKAKTNEGLGFIGREEGLAVLAVVTVVKKT